MGLTMHERRKVTKRLLGRYKRSGKKQKGVILDSFVEVTGYTRAYAACVLRGGGRRRRGGGRPPTR